MSVSVVTLPGQVRLGHDEARLSLLHAWIAALCDPGSGLVTELNTSVRPVRRQKQSDMFTEKMRIMPVMFCRGIKLTTNSYLMLIAVGSIV